MRRRSRDLDADVGVFGRLIVMIVEHQPVMELRKWGTPNVMQPNMLFPLYKPEIISFDDRGMIVRGFQRHSMSSSEPAPTCLQEWIVNFEREVPAVNVGSGHMS